MRILFVAPYVPSLIRVRPYHWIKSLTALGHAVTVVALGTDGAAQDEEARAALAPLCEAVHVVPHSRAQAALQCALSLPTPTPLWAAYCHSPALVRTLRRLLNAQSFDVAHIEHLRAAHFARALPTLPLVFDAVDCLTSLQQQMRAAPGRGLPARLVSWEEECKLRRYEPRTAALFQQTLITSAHDADALQALAQAAGVSLPLSVIPNGVDLGYFQPPAPQDERASRTVVFSGKMSYAANHDAALYFARDIWPRIRRACPDATLILAGSGPRADLRALGASPRSGIHVTGHVPDLRPFLAQAAVAVCPLRIGVGIQNKALEAMAMGLSVVATPLAARALPPDAPGRVLRTVSTPAEFADAVIDLLAHPARARQMGLAARAYVETHHDWHALAGRLTGLYQDAISAFTRAE